MLRCFCLILVLCLLPSAGAVHADSHSQPVRVLMTVGGVSYHTAIVRQLRASDRVSLTVVDVDDRPQAISSSLLADVDALLMYHRDNEADAAERAALDGFMARGGGVVVLHHAIANYQDWPEWWRDRIGGLYRFAGDPNGPPSAYFYGFIGALRPAGEHPVTRRLGTSWRVEDESYSDLWVSEHVQPLLTTTAFGSDPIVAWIGPSKEGRAVFIQPGHGAGIMADPRYIHLLEDALHWVAASNETAD